MPWDKVDWTTVGGGLLFVAATLIAAIGRVFASPAKSATPNHAVEVAGALIDTKRVDGLIAALDMNTMAAVASKTELVRNTTAIQSHQMLIEASAKAAALIAENADKLAREMRDLRDETKDLRDEMLRRGRNI